MKHRFMIWYTLPDIIRVSISRRMRGVEGVAGMGEEKSRELW
jgi:hypothetical protein